MNLTIKAITEYAKGTLLNGSPDKVLNNMTTDSRSVPEKALFVPIKGEHMDGHRFLKGAVENGAEAVLCEKPDLAEELLKDCPEVSVILVDDTTKALQNIAKGYRKTLSFPAVGVTGSVGKTTTREMISTALSAGLDVFKTTKNFNNWLGVPTTLLSMDEGPDIAVLELGMNVPGELGLISSLTNIDTAVITNIGVAHMEFYGSQEKIAREKFTVTRGFDDDNPREKTLFLNAEDPYLMQLKDEAGCNTVLFGRCGSAEYEARNIRTEEGKRVFDLYVRGEYRFPVRLTVLGDHNVLNATCALAVADHYHVDLRKAAEKLEEYRGYAGRLQEHEKDGIRYIDDTYNASPVSMKAGLDILEGLQNSGKKTAVLGDMFELGENSPEFHREVVAYALTKKIDNLFLLGNNMKEALQETDISNAPFRVRHFDDQETLISLLKEESVSGDVIYLKASNGMKFKEILGALI